MQPAPDPVLLIHGQPGSARDWDRVRATIDGRLETIAIDRPGWDGRGPATGLDGNAAAALAALDVAGANRATVAGHSFGAAVAASLAISDPERVGALVLAAPAANVASLVRLDRMLALPHFGYLLSAAALASAGGVMTLGPVRRRIAKELHVDGRYLRGAGRALLRPATWRAFSDEQQMLIDELPALERRLGQISAPTTIVIGTDDRIVPPRSARQLATQIPRADLVELERANHLLLQQRAAALAEIIVGAARAAAEDDEG